MEENVKEILKRQLEILAAESEGLHGKENKEVPKRIEKLCALTEQMEKMGKLCLAVAPINSVMDAMKAKTMH